MPEPFNLRSAFLPGLRLLFVGESLVLAGAIERAKSRGHRVLGIFSAAASEAAAMARAGMPVQGPEGDVAEFVAAHEFDVLFSVINAHILKAETLALPRLAAVNYHNAPLPAYAGMWATAQAVLNGEKSHGVTWHLMAPGIDTGAILAQRRFPLAPDETTATLNRRCTEAALESLDQVFDLLEAGKVAGQAQDLSKRTYHSRFDTAPNGGFIDWHWPTEKILRLVRACDWGPWSNPFGKAAIRAPDGEAWVVRSAELVTGSAPPGTVVAREDKALTVACEDGLIRFVLQACADVAAGACLPAGAYELPATAGSRPPTGSAPIASNRSFKSGRSVIESLAAQAASDHDAAAVEGQGTALSRGQLASRSAAVAAMLIRLGLRPEDGVGILIPGGSEFVVAALGAMRAGGAYVPLDPASPHNRIRLEIAEAGVTHVLVTEDAGYQAVDFPGCRFVCIGDSGERDQAGTPLPTVPLERCAYRAFTSGSTGRPKAVEITHAGLANLLEHYRSALPMGPSDRMTMLSYPSFDASVADVWPILAAGGVLLEPPPRILLDPAGLIHWLADSRASLTFVPTAVAERLMCLNWPKDLHLRVLLTGGDTLHRRPPAGLGFRVINTYGPTENTVDSLWAVVEPDGDIPTIGRPITGVTATVVDDARRPVAPGTVGELVLGGAQVARGYRGRAESNARQFGTDAAGQRCYYTGDLVRINAQGEFEFHGRSDDQVQVLGVRVEPGEIEALLKTDRRVQEAVCLPIRAGLETTGLAAHLVMRPGVTRNPALAVALRELLAGHLPSALVPKKIEFHPSLPFSATGKIDRRALMEQYKTVEDTGAADCEHDAVRALWLRAVPAAAHAGEARNFWDLGGDSLGVMELLTGLERSTGVRLPIGLFLADPTLTGLRRELSLRRNPVITRLSSGKGPPLILWYLASGDLEGYQHLVPLLGEREIFGVMSPAFFDLHSAHGTLEEAVSFALSSIRQFGIFEAPALLGYSFAGLLAFEAARQLAREQMPPPFVGLIGTQPPMQAHGRIAGLVEALRWTLRRVWNTLVDVFIDPAAVAKRIKRRIKKSRNVHINSIHYGMGSAYQPGLETAINICLFRERIALRTNRRPAEFNLADYGWSHWTGTKPRIKWIDADHNSMMKGAPAMQLAEMIGEELDRLG